MQPLITSHQWHEKNGICPAIKAVVMIAGPYPSSLVRCGGENCWVLDYEFNSFGQVRVQAPHSQWRARPPHTAHLYPPAARFWEDTRKEKGFRHSAWIHFNGSREIGLENLIPEERGHARFLDDGEHIGLLMNAIAKAGMEYGEAGFWKAQADFCAIINLLFTATKIENADYRICPGIAHPRSSELIQTVAAYLTGHIAEKISLREIARSLNMSVSTLAHRYPHEAGETVMATLIRMRVERATLLLTKGNRLKNIADILGFSDAFHFSRTFKRAQGVSPREYIARHP
jgi:AraC-like DNA-binding protein